MENITARRGGFVGPIILIGLGALFLMNNLGFLNWSVWQAIATLWPVVLIAIGLDILFGRRSALGSILIGLIALGFIGIVAMSSLFANFAIAPRFGPTTLTRESISQTLDNATRADVDISFPAGRLQLGALNEGNQLIEGTMDINSGARLTRDFSVSSDTAYLKLREQGAPSVAWGWNWGRDRVWDLKLNRTMPMKLKLNTGVGQSDLNLEQLNLTALDINTGVGQTRLTLPARGKYSTKLDGGVGETTIVIPKGMAARIRVRTGLGDRSVIGDFQRQGDYYVSPNYGTATDQVDLSVNAGIGQITIRQDP